MQENWNSWKNLKKRKKNPSKDIGLIRAKNQNKKMFFVGVPFSK
jgi:hypothetical protein